MSRANPWRDLSLLVSPFDLFISGETLLPSHSGSPSTSLSKEQSLVDCFFVLWDLNSKKSNDCVESQGQKS